MRAASWLPVLAAALVLAGCGGEEDTPARPVPPLAAGLSPQRELATPTLRRTTVAGGFDRPYGLVREPGPRGRVLVLEQRGTARWLDGDGPAPGPPFLDLRGTVSTTEDQGLLGLAFLGGAGDDPGRVVVHASDRDGASRITRYAVRGGRVDVAGGEPLLRVEQPYANHTGGQLAIGPDRRLYLGLGDGGSAFDPRQKAQDPSSQLGKVLSADPTAARPEWRQAALGLRNPWRLHFDDTGALWVADAGRDSAEAQTEEINRIPARMLRPGRRPANLGWAAYEGTRDQTNRRLAPDAGELLWPVASYTQRDGCNAVGGLVLRGDVLPVLRDRYVFGDTCSGLVWSIPADARPGAEVRREGVRVPQQTAYLLDGRRLLVSSLDGRVYRLTGAR